MSITAPEASGGLQAVVTLVPGTWARKATWTREGSRLHTALAEAGCTVVPFEWSHSNCHRARTRAALKLEEQLRVQIKKYPDARQWVVAHSHGGNIALHAVGRLRASCAEAPRVSTVTLATPFIHARQRARSGWSVFILALFGAPAICWASVTLPGAPLWGALWRVLVVGVALLFIVGAVMHGVTRFGT